MTSEPIHKDVASYLARGWPVVPVHVTRNDDGKKVVFLAEHGFKDASTDYDVVADWAIRHPTCGWAIATGPESFFAVDVDKGGIEAWEALTQKNGSVKTMAVKTPGGGYHFYYTWPEGVDKIKSSTGELAPGVDVRGTGGCVFAPPTPGYSLVNGERGPAAPTWLIDALASPTRHRGAPQVIVEQSPDQKIAKGQRNVTLTSKAGTMRRAGFGVEAIAAALHFHNAEFCDPPLPSNEVDQIAASIGKHESAAQAEIQSWHGQGLDIFPVLIRTIPEERPQLIENFLDTERLVMLYGKLGDFKSFLAMVAAVAIASGKRWLSSSPLDGMVTLQSPVVFVQQDQGRKDTSDRLHALFNAYDISETIPLRLYSFPRPTLNLLRNYEALIEAVHRHKAKLVVIDNLFNAAGVRDENSSEVGLAIKHLAELRDDTGAAVLLIHHPAKAADWSRGSSTILQNVDQSLKLIRDKEFVSFKSEKDRVAGASADLVARFSYEYYEGTHLMRSARFVRSDADALKEREFEETNAALLEYVGNNPGIGKNETYAAVGGQRTKTSRAAQRLILAGKLAVRTGKNRKHHLYLPEDVPESEQVIP